MMHSEVTIQITPQSFPSLPSWMGEVTVFAQVLTHTGILKTIQEQVRFARARFGTYELIEFVVMLIGYAVSSEPTLKAFYERLAPFAESFMALDAAKPTAPLLNPFPLSCRPRPASCGSLAHAMRKRICWRANRFPPSVACLIAQAGSGWSSMWTRQATRQRALPQTEALPAPHRRFDQVCAPGYQGRKRGEVVRTHTILLQVHTHQFFGTLGGAGNGDYCSELRRAIQVITSYAAKLGSLCAPV